MRHCRCCRRCLLPVAVLALIWTGPQPLAAEDRAPRLPVKAFFGNPEFSDPQLSPDGKHIAMLVSRGDTLLVAVRATEGGELKLIGRISEPQIRPRWLHWANNTRLLISLQMRDSRTVGFRARRHRLFGIDMDSKNARLLGVTQSKDGLEEWGVQFEDEILHWPLHDPDHVLILYRDQEFPSARLVDVSYGRLSVAMPSRVGVHFWHVDHDGEVRAGEGHQSGRYTLYARANAKTDFEKIEDIDLNDNKGFRFAGFSFDPSKIYVHSRLDGRQAIYEYNLAAKQLGDLVFAPPAGDAGELIFDEERRRLIAVDYIGDEAKRHFLDKDAEREQMAIDKALPGTANAVVSQSRDHSRAIVERSGDAHAPEYYLFLRDTQPKRLDFLLAAYPELTPGRLAPMRSVSYLAHDGLTIPAYLTLPNGVEPKRLPVIVLPHGGPTAQDYRHFDQEVQFFANRGFAVFQMNFRGSGGLGDQHLESGYGQWGLAMQDDITDGVKWLIEQGIADPARIGIYGSSYGGYAALMGLVRTPDLYRAGASYAGVTSLSDLLSADQWYLFGDHSKTVSGRGPADSKRLRENSPVDNAAKIRLPVFLAHGEDDDHVHVKHSQMMAKALRNAGKDVEYLEFPHEFHGFLLEQNRLRFYERLGEFFEKHLAAKVSAGG